MSKSSELERFRAALQKIASMRPTRFDSEMLMGQQDARASSVMQAIAERALAGKDLTLSSNRPGTSESPSHPGTE